MTLLLPCTCTSVNAPVVVAFDTEETAIWLDIPMIELRVAVMVPAAVTSTISPAASSPLPSLGRLPEPMTVVYSPVTLLLLPMAIEFKPFAVTLAPTAVA